MLKVKITKATIILLTPVFVFMLAKNMGIDMWLAFLFVAFISIIYFIYVWRKGNTRETIFQRENLNSASVVCVDEIGSDCEFRRGYIVSNENLIFSEIKASTAGLYIIKDLKSAYFLSWSDISVVRDENDSSYATLTIFDCQDKKKFKIPWSDEFQAKRLSAL